MSKENTSTATLKLEYSEICTSYHNVRDRELKLFTLIPIASTTAASVLIKTSEHNHRALAVALVSFVLTLGLFLYSLRGIRHGNRLVEQGGSLEKELGLTNTTGQFVGRPSPKFGGYTAAETLIYVSVLAAWVYAAYLAL